MARVLSQLRAQRAAEAAMVEQGVAAEQFSEAENKAAIRRAELVGATRQLSAEERVRWFTTGFASPNVKAAEPLTAAQAWDNDGVVWHWTLQEREALATALEAQGERRSAAYVRQLSARRELHDYLHPARRDNKQMATGIRYKTIGADGVAFTPGDPGQDGQQKAARSLRSRMRPEAPPKALMAKLNKAAAVNLHTLGMEQTVVANLAKDVIARALPALRADLRERGLS